jgi:hypothetical protein
LDGLVFSGADHHRLYARGTPGSKPRDDYGLTFVAVIGSYLNGFVVLVDSASRSCNGLTHSGTDSLDRVRTLSMTASWDVAVYSTELICLDGIERSSHIGYSGRSRL